MEDPNNPSVAGFLNMEGPNSPYIVPSSPFVAEFSATWNPMEDVSHDVTGEILLHAEQVKQFPCPIEPKHNVTEAEAGADSPEHPFKKPADASLPWSKTAKKWDKRTMKKIRALEEVKLGSYDLFFIRDNYKCKETMEAYLAGMNDEQRSLCVAIRAAIMTAKNQRDVRDRKKQEIKMLEQKYEEKRVLLEVERAYGEHLKERSGIAKRMKCDALLAFCDRCREQGVEIPEWVKNL